LGGAGQCNHQTSETIVFNLPPPMEGENKEKYLNHVFSRWVKIPALMHHQGDEIISLGAVHTFLHIKHKYMSTLYEQMQFISLKFC
jgi:hypothetical protein